MAERQPDRLGDIPVIFDCDFFLVDANVSVAAIPPRLAGGWQPRIVIPFYSIPNNHPTSLSRDNKSVINSWIWPRIEKMKHNGIIPIYPARIFPLITPTVYFTVAAACRPHTCYETVIPKWGGDVLHAGSSNYPSFAHNLQVQLISAKRIWAGRPAEDSHQNTVLFAWAALTHAKENSVVIRQTLPIGFNAAGRTGTVVV